MKLPKFSFRKKSKPDTQTEESGQQAEPEEQVVGPGASAAQSSGGAKQWLILHFEKICLVAAGLIFGFLIYTAVGKLSLNPRQDATELANKAQQMETMIEQSDWDGSTDRIPDFAAQVRDASRPIEKDKYSFKSIVGFESEKLRKRTWPKFLPAENLWVEGGSGIFWIAGQQEEAKDDPLNKDAPNAGGNAVKLSRGDYEGQLAPKGAMAEMKHWAAVTALIPSKKQNMLYERTFQEAEDYRPGEDVPNYLLARIRRMQLTADDPEGKNLDWDNPDFQWEWTPQSAKNKTSVAETALGRLNPKKHDRWATGARELVDARYIHPRLTTPLGPLGYIGWQQWATHPEIPLAKKKSADNTDDLKQKIRGGGGNRILNGRIGRGNGNAAKNAVGPDRAEQFADFFNPPEKDSDQDSTNKADDNGKENRTLDSVADENQLLRLFDFNVEPGKTYIYQVQLLLKNPNHNKPSRILRDPAHRKSLFVPDQKLPWSKQSAPVYIPPLTEVFAAAVADPVKKEATVIIKTPSGSEGSLLIGELTLPQGGVVVDGSLPKERSYKMDGLTQQLLRGDDPLDAELLLVDIRSQVPLAGETGVSDLLFLDASGEFLLKNTASVLDQKEANLFTRLSSAYDQGIKKQQEAQEKRNRDKDEDGKQKDEALLDGKKAKGK